MKVDQTALRALLGRGFSLEEIKTLCVDIDIDFDILPGQDKLSKSRELIKYLERRSQIERLISYCIKERPQLDWAATIHDALDGSVAVIPQASRDVDPWRTEFNLRFLKAANVSIHSEDGSMCSGFFVEPSGYVCTCLFADWVNKPVKIKWGGEEFEGQVVAHDDTVHLGMVTVKKQYGRLFPSIPLGDDKELRVSDRRPYCE